jgi:transcriptional regulator with XRE-family HTH domain
MARHFSGPRLREARIAAGLRPEQLALSIGRSVYSIHDYERGRVRPPVDVLADIAEVLHRDINDLLAEEIRHVA